MANINLTRQHRLLVEHPEYTINAVSYFEEQHHTMFCKNLPVAKKVNTRRKTFAESIFNKHWLDMIRESVNVVVNIEDGSLRNREYAENNHTLNGL